MSRTRWMPVGVTLLLTLALAASAVCAKEEGARGGKAGEAKAKVDLPEAAAKALQAAFPKATVDEAKAEDKGGVKVFDVELKQDKTEMDVEVTADGAILAVETNLEMKDVPGAAAKVLQKAAEGATVKEVQKEEVRAEIKDAKVVKLDAVKVAYEAEIKKGDQKGEIKVAADGTVVEELKWTAEKKQEKVEKGEKDEKDDEVGEHESGE